jgi:hypothetical protein
MPKKNPNFYNSKILFQSFYILFGEKNQKYAKACEELGSYIHRQI